MRLRTYFLIFGITALLVGAGMAYFPATAAPGVKVQEAGVAALPPVQENDVCLVCHQNPQFSTQLSNGEVLELYVNPETLNASVHGENQLQCVQCHVGFQPANGHGLTFASRREVTLSMNDSCAQCHATQADQEKDGVHAAARAAGQMKAAVCTDCHTAHEVHRVTDPNTGALLPEVRAGIPQTCEKCHSEIYQKYRNSVHGAALVDENNPDVPTCIDCHGVHFIEDPTTAAFRLKSPQICARCHTDPAIMDKYGLNTQVLDTYVADFHGTTVTIFEQVSPDAATNKPVCYDCHGIHDIVKVDDPQKGLSVKANLLDTCKKCHPGATINFPDSWLSHYIPSPEKYPMVYFIDLFYKFFIPAVLIPMAILVAMDFGRKMLNRFGKPPAAPPVEVPAEPVKPAPASESVEASVEEAQVVEEIVESAPAEAEAPVAEQPVVGEVVEEPETPEEPVDESREEIAPADDSAESKAEDQSNDEEARNG